MYKNYNINQLVLLLNLEIKIQDNDIAKHVNNLVESIPQKAFSKYYKETGCPAYHPRMMLKILYRSQCCKAKEGNNRKISVNVKREQQKEYIRMQLSDKKTSQIYKSRKIGVEPVFGFLKANLRFNRFTLRGKIKAKIEMGLALMTVNLRKYTQRMAAA